MSLLNGNFFFSKQLSPVNRSHKEETYSLLTLFVIQQPVLTLVPKYEEMIVILHGVSAVERV